jgi:hypothetical protein
MSCARLLLLATSASMSLGLIGAAQAGPCSEAIAEFETTLGRSDPEVTGAIATPQATGPGSAAQAHGASPPGDAIDAALARARKFDAEGRRPECQNALAAAKRLAKSR